MAGEWPLIAMGEVAAVRSGYAFKSRDWKESGIPVVKIANVKSGRLEMAGCSFVDEAVASGAGECRLSVGDILVAMTGYVGDVARVRESDLPCVLNQRVGKFTVLNEKRLDADYLFQFLAWSDTRQTIAGLGYGSAQPNVSPSLIHKIEIPLPPLPEQKRIAHILGTLDDKIELNRRMNATLEGISRALFKSWFVDFDPVRQKAAGKQPVGIDAQTAALFPNSFEDSEIGEVPKGWRVAPLDEIADYLNGLALQKYPAGDGPTLPVIKIAQLRKGDATGADRCNDAVPSEYVIEDGDVLFSWSGSLEVVIWCGGRGALNQHLFKVTSQSYPKWFYHLWTLHHLADFRLIAADKATTMGHIQRKHLSAAKVIVPPAGCIDGMTRTMEPLRLQSVRTRKESRTLAALRDTLLPKLLSGEIRVPEAEQAVEEAIA
jgi:type I restriction enzyme S subunit